MSAPPEIVGQHELAFFFETNEPVPARPLLNFLYEVERIARTQRHLGPSALVEIIEVATGTKLVRLTFDRKVTLGSLAVAVAALGNDLVDRFQKPAGRLAESVAELCLDHGVVECVITTAEGQVRIKRDQLPAVDAVEKRRERLESARKEARLSEDFLLSDAEAQLSPALDRPELRWRPRAIGDALPAGPSRADGRIYTLIGTLRKPRTRGNSVPADDWQFDTSSGKTYIARGLNPDRLRYPDLEVVVIRAEILGRESGYTVLSVKDVFESEEP